MSRIRIRTWKVLAYAIGALCAQPISAKVERVPVACGEQLCLWERPTLKVPAGWSLDAYWSAKLKTSIYTPGETGMGDAPAYVTAQAFPRADATFADFIQAEVDRLVGASLALESLPVAQMRDGSGATLPARRVSPRSGRSGTIQTIVFAEDGDHFVEITLNARNASAHERTWNDFVRFVRGYYRTPPQAQPRR